jgi:hypothetical protein
MGERRQMRTAGEAEPSGGPPETIGALLARARLQHGISQLRLAERLCASSGQATVTRHEVSRWEREERIPTPYWLTWLAAVLDLPLGELERAAAAARCARGDRPTPPGQVGQSWSRVTRMAEQDDGHPGYVQLAPGVFRRAS